MENKNKEKAINQILLGLALKFFPLIILGLFKRYLNSLFPNLSILIAVLIVVFFLVGYVFFIKGCYIYSKSKGYSYKWGWLGLLSLLGLSILLLIPSKGNIASLQDESLVNEPWNKINIPELFLSWLIALPVLFWSILGLFYSFNNLNFADIIKNLTILNLLTIAYSLFWVFILLKTLQKAGLKFNKIIGYKNYVNLKLVTVIIAIEFAFAKGSNTLILYNLSFVFPKYVESYINEKDFTNILEMILWSFSAMLLAPIIEEFFFRGIILQKWAVKWAVKSGILTSSLLFAILHFRFDIIPLFIMGTLSSILYFKTRSLITSMLFHFFYNTIVTILNVVDYFNTSAIERSAFISVKEYQVYIQPLLNQRVFLLTISIPFLLYFIYKIFPKNDAIIPYYTNEAKTSEIN
ncbi:MAG: type II CAAX endopeptidase family protein [Nostoc sp.]|uniref:CPBP family intramembrane glutamic endopeptidase n=1 Tax=Nostoc sp. TaxID=1180 RepID=UPI002FF6BAC8